MRWGRRIGLGLVALLVVLAVAYGFAPKPLPVDAVAAARGPLRVTVDEEGRTRVVDRFVISAPVAGYLRRVELDVGDAVERGEVLAVLEPLRSDVLDPRSRAAAEAQLAAAQASLQVATEAVTAARAEADYADAELERIRRLYEAGEVSAETFDQAQSRQRQAQASLRSAQFSVQVAEFEVETARTRLKYSAAEGNADPVEEQVAIRAPVNGRILAIHQESEGVVAAGQPLLEAGDARHLEVAVDVLSADAVRIEPGTRVLFERWGGGTPLEGRVRRVEPVGFTKISALGVEEQRVWVISDIVSPPQAWQRVGDGYRVEASFILWEDEHALQVPTSALFRYQDEWAVFVVEDANAERNALTRGILAIAAPVKRTLGLGDGAEEGIARRRLVGVGHRSGLNAEIVSGLDDGDRVITHPDREVENGTAVVIRQA